MWKIVQCAVQGRGHMQMGIPCQDKTYSLVKNGVTAIALADGAGSARLSHFGAERVTEYICDDLSENFDRYFHEEDGVPVKKALISKSILALDELSRKLNCEIRELASTLLVVAVKDERFILFHIGDGVIGYCKKGELKVASQPENGEFVNTTVFTTSQEALTTMKLIKGKVGDIRGFVLMSDGTEASLYDKKEKRLADVIKKIMNLCQLVLPRKVEEQLRTSFEVAVRQATSDDCSMILMVEDREPFRGYAKLAPAEKARLLKLPAYARPRRLRRYDAILSGLENGRTLRNISKIIRLNPKYTKKYLNRLMGMNFIARRGIKYYTIVIMDTQ